MNTFRRARCSRGHFLASKDVHTTLGPEDWDDTCRCKPSTQQQREPGGEDFGHRPVVLPFSGVRCCARCVERVSFAVGWDGCWETGLVSVPWPCTSAVVLGVAGHAGAVKPCAPL